MNCANNVSLQEMDKLDISHLNHEFETATPQEILAWAWQQFNPQIAATSSFQSQS